MADIVIDLTSPDDTPVARADRVRPRWRQRAAVAMAGVLALTALAAAQPAGPPELALLATIDDPGGLGVVGVADGLIFRFDQGRVAAHELDGALRWRSESRLPEGFNVSKVRDWYVVTGRGASVEQATTLVLDPASGSEISRGQGRLLIAGAVFVYLGSGDEPAPVRRIDSRQTVWHVPPWLLSGWHPGSETLFTVDERHVLTEWELATGKVRRSLVLPTRPGTLRLMSMQDQFLYVLTDRYPDGLIRVELATLSERPPQSGEPLGTQDCGPVICVFDERGTASILERSTGRALWQGPHDGSFMPTPAGVLMQDSSDSSWLIDYSTGHRVRLPGWRQVLTISPGDAVLMRRSSDDKKRTEFGVIVPGGVRHVATISYVWPACVHAGDLVACKMPDQKIGVWRLGWSGARGDHRSGPSSSG